jgi:hypothetical protein
MRRLVAAAVILTAFVAATAERTASAPARAVGACTGVNAVDVYFWPQGHGVVPQIGFPAFAPPHLELYRAGDLTTETGFLVYAGARESNFVRLCFPPGGPAAAWARGPEATTREQMRITCNLPGEADARVANWNRVTTRTRFVRVKGKRVKRTIRRTTRLGNTFTVGVAGSGAFVVARIGASSTMRYDTRYCQPNPF